MWPPQTLIAHFAEDKKTLWTSVMVYIHTQDNKEGNIDGSWLKCLTIIKTAQVFS